MKKAITAAVCVCLMLAGCGEKNTEVTDASKAEAETSVAEVQTEGQSFENSRTAAFIKRIEKHDFSMTLCSQQSGGSEVTEEIEVYGNVLHDVYKNAEGNVTGEMFIVDGELWSVTNEGSNVPVYVGEDEHFDEHVLESVFHCAFISDAEKFGGVQDGAEKINGSSESLAFLYTYGDDGVLKEYESGGAHYKVMGFSEGTGEVELPESLKNAMMQRES